MRLALVMGRTLRELQDDMGGDEFTLWKAYEAEYGLADGYTVAGVLAPLIARVFGGNEQVTAADFVPYFRAQRRPASGDELLARFKALTGQAPP